MSSDPFEQIETVNNIKSLHLSVLPCTMRKSKTKMSRFMKAPA